MSIMTTMRTVSGHKFAHRDPFNSVISIEDIGHALSHICRYNGHVQKFYSVAEHCVYVSQLVPQHLAMYGLLHDAAEAYIGDVTRPVRALFPNEEIENLEIPILRAVFEKVGLDPDIALEEVYDIDDQMVALERPEWDIQCRLRSEGVVLRLNNWSPEEARRKFFSRYYEILGS